MISPLAKFLDWSAIQYVAFTGPAKASSRGPKLEEVMQFLRSPEFITLDINRRRLNSTARLTSTFPRPVHAASRKMTWFVAGFTAAASNLLRILGIDWRTSMVVIEFNRET